MAQSDRKSNSVSVESDSVETNLKSFKKSQIEKNDTENKNESKDIIDIEKGSPDIPSANQNRNGGNERSGRRSRKRRLRVELIEKQKMIL